MNIKELAIGFAVGAVALGASAKFALHLAPEPAIVLPEGVGRAAGSAEAGWQGGAHVASNVRRFDHRIVPLPDDPAALGVPRD